MTTHKSNTTRRRRAHPERGWVLLATLALSAIAASLTLAWARHAVLAKSWLEMESGASETEEAARSAIERAREQMRRGHPPGCECDGTEEVVTTNEGTVVTVSRHEENHQRRTLRAQADDEGIGGGNSDHHEMSSVRAKARVSPVGGGSGKKTSVKCENEGTLLAGNVTIINGTQSYSNTTLAGLMLLENGATLTLEDVVLRGTIVTRGGLCKDHPLSQGGGRPRVVVEGGLRLLAGTELPDVAMCAPDAIFEASATSNVEIDGMTVADEFIVPGRGTVRGMVVAESNEIIGPDVSRPNHGRGPQDWPDTIETGAELVTAMSFPASDPTEAELVAMDSYDADG